MLGDWRLLPPINLLGPRAQLVGQLLDPLEGPLVRFGRHRIGIGDGGLHCRDRLLREPSLWHEIDAPPHAKNKPEAAWGLAGGVRPVAAAPWNRAYGPPKPRYMLETASDFSYGPAYARPKVRSQRNGR